MPSLGDYERKRNFRKTPEPKGSRHKSAESIFVVQRHAARRLHFDFRLGVNGALASWAVPKGPPEEAGEKRLAIHVEDHPLDYASFEGEIPKGNYGSGQVQIWDKGTEVEGPESAAEQIDRGDFKFQLHGQRLNGRFVLVKIRRSEKGNEWLLIRKSVSENPSTAISSGAEHGKSRTSTLAHRDGGQEIVDPGSLSGVKKAAMHRMAASPWLLQLSQMNHFPIQNGCLKLSGMANEHSRGFVTARCSSRARSGRDMHHVTIPN